MNIDVHFTIPEVDAARVAEGGALVIDVVRATSTIAEALANGAQAVFPVEQPEEAIRLANSLGRDDALVCGERRGVRVDGFDLGNSPREFVPDRVAGRKLVMSTTNGTRAFLAAELADPVVSCSFLNLSAAAREVARCDRLSVVCAGREDRFSLDDALCAGLVVAEVIEDRAGGDGVSLNDAARAALELAGLGRPTRSFLEATAAGAALVEVDLAEDLDFVVAWNRHDIAPRMVDRTIRLPPTER